MTATFFVCRQCKGL